MSVTRRCCHNMEEYESRIMRLKLSRFFPAHGVQNELDAARDPQFLKNAVQIVTHRVLGDMKNLSNFAVFLSFRNQPSYLVFSRREQVRPLALVEPRSELGEGLKQKLDVSIVGPDLTVVDTTDTLRERLKGIVPAQDTPRPAAECIDHRLAIGRLQQHDWNRARMGVTYSFQNSQARLFAVP